MKLPIILAAIDLKVILLGLLIAFLIAIVLIVEMRSLLLGEGADPRDMARLRESIAAAPHVQRVLHVKTQHFGPQELLVAAQIDFSDELTTEGLAAAIEEVERLVREAVPYANPIYGGLGGGIEGQAVLITAAMIALNVVCMATCCLFAHAGVYTKPSCS